MNIFSKVSNLIHKINPNPSKRGYLMLIKQDSSQTHQKEHLKVYENDPKSRDSATEQLVVASYHSLSEFDNNRGAQILGSSWELIQFSSKTPILSRIDPNSSPKIVH